jgi:hypothetical protein
MSDAAIFVLIFGGLFVLRFVLATLCFLYILPDGDRCPNCDAVTLRMQAKWGMRRQRWFRPSWCLACGWEGMLRVGPLTPVPGGATVVKAALPTRPAAEGVVEEP